MNFLPKSDIPSHIPRHIIGLRESESRIKKVRKWSNVVKVVGVIFALVLIINSSFIGFLKPVFKDVYGENLHVNQKYIVKPVTQAELASLSSPIKDPTINNNTAVLAYVVPAPHIQEGSLGDINSDPRIKAIYNFLKANSSPMADNASDFVIAADQTGIDYRLVASISGAESGFGRVIPYGRGGAGLSYNSWGWDDPSGRGFEYFASWSDAIYRISKGISTAYGKNSTPYSMEATYCPPCKATNQWENEVASNMETIASMAK